MEEGWDRLKAAIHSHRHAAADRALITTAAFMPIGFAPSTTGEYAGGIFWIVPARAAASAHDNPTELRPFAYHSARGVLYVVSAAMAMLQRQFDRH